MIYQRDRIVRDVRIAMDENREDNILEGFGDVEALAFDELIESKIEEAAIRVLSDAPLAALGAGKKFDGSVYHDSSHNPRCWVMLPEDYLRLITIKVDEWEREISLAMPIEVAMLTGYASANPVLRGTRVKPKAVEVNKEIGRVMELYPCYSYSEVTASRYLPYPKFDRDGGIEIPERCYKDVVNATAMLAKVALGDAAMPAQEENQQQE